MTIDQAVELLIEFVEIETWLLLGGFATVVAYQLLSGRINLAGLLEDKGRASSILHGSSCS